MGRRKGTRIPGVRLKFRTYLEHEDGKPPETGIEWATAGVSLDGGPTIELARIRKDLLGEDPSDPRYQAWIDMVSDLWGRELANMTGIDGLFVKRVKPNYRGEEAAGG